MSGHSVKRSPIAIAAAVLVAVIAAVHLQQYIDFISEVPTVGVLFLLNAAGGAGLAAALLSDSRQLRVLAVLGSLGLAGGSLVSIAIALQGSLFGYSEQSLRLPIPIAILSEAAAIPMLLVMLGSEGRLRPAPRRA